MGDGSVKIYFGEDNVRATIVPTIEMIIASYDVYGSGPGGAVFTDTASGMTSRVEDGSQSQGLAGRALSAVRIWRRRQQRTHEDVSNTGSCEGRLGRKSVEAGIGPALHLSAVESPSHVLS